MVICQAFVMPVYISRFFDIPLRRQFTKGFFTPLGTGIPALLFNVGIVAARSPMSWRTFALEVASCAIFNSALCWFFGLRQHERIDLLARLGYNSTATKQVRFGDAL